ncbi:MAG: hypothetical protein OEX12_05910 [Gammaproteobacteria bacterium]|nr:hypothetical protein [Gammaproteobacteria bacterium]
MNVRTKQSMRWFSEQCPGLDDWLKDSPVAEYVKLIEVYHLNNDLIYLEFKTEIHQFLIISTSESENYPSLMSFAFSDRYGDSPMSKGYYDKSTWCKIEKDILHVIQAGIPASFAMQAKLPGSAGND